MQERESASSVYSTRLFSKRQPVCPNCHSGLAAGAEKCTRCGFDAHMSVAQNPYPAPQLQSLLQVHEILDEDGQRKFHRLHQKFAAKFPGLRLNFCSLNLSPEANLKTFGFWLLNAAPHTSGDVAAERRNTILIIWDAANSRLGVTLGYDLEVFLADQEVESAIEEAFQHLMGKRHIEAIEILFRDLMVVIEGAWERAMGQLSKARGRKS